MVYIQDGMSTAQVSSPDPETDEIERVYNFLNYKIGLKALMRMILRNIHKRCHAGRSFGRVLSLVVKLRIKGYIKH